MGLINIDDWAFVDSSNFFKRDSFDEEFQKQRERMEEERKKMEEESKNNREGLTNSYDSQIEKQNEQFQKNHEQWEQDRNAAMEESKNQTKKIQDSADKIMKFTPLIPIIMFGGFFLFIGTIFTCIYCCYKKNNKNKAKRYQQIKKNNNVNTAIPNSNTNSVGNTTNNVTDTTQQPSYKDYVYKLNKFLNDDDDSKTPSQPVNTSTQPVNASTQPASPQPNQYQNYANSFNVSPQPAPAVPGSSPYQVPMTGVPNYVPPQPQNPYQYTAPAQMLNNIQNQPPNYTILPQNDVQGPPLDPNQPIQMPQPGNYPNNPSVSMSQAKC